jgi:hypothetical protein
MLVMRLVLFLMSALRLLNALEQPELESSFGSLL